MKSFAVLKKFFLFEFSFYDWHFLLVEIFRSFFFCNIVFIFAFRWWKKRKGEKNYNKLNDSLHKSAINRIYGCSLNFLHEPWIEKKLKKNRGNKIKKYIFNVFVVLFLGNKRFHCDLSNFKSKFQNQKYNLLPLQWIWFALIFANLASSTV